MDEFMKKLRKVLDQAEEDLSGEDYEDFLSEAADEIGERQEGAEEDEDDEDGD